LKWRRIDPLLHPSLDTRPEDCDKAEWRYVTRSERREAQYGE
jgi:hypothetical protein